jgi:hypothetical protein
LSHYLSHPDDQPDRRDDGCLLERGEHKHASLGWNEELQYIQHKRVHGRNEWVNNDLTRDRSLAEEICRIRVVEPGVILEVKNGSESGQDDGQPHHGSTTDPRNSSASAGTVHRRLPGRDFPRRFSDTLSDTLTGGDKRKPANEKEQLFRFQSPKHKRDAGG